MRNLYLAAITCYLFFCLQSIAISQESNWTQFRGTNLNGISNDTNVPVSWNDSVNVAWKAKLNGKGWSSPVIFGDQIWLTTATEDGKKMFTVCTSLKSGKELFNIKLFEPDKTYAKHDINTYA